MVRWNSFKPTNSWAPLLPSKWGSNNQVWCNRLTRRPRTLFSTNIHTLCLPRQSPPSLTLITCKASTICPSSKLWVSFKVTIRNKARSGRCTTRWETSDQLLKAKSSQPNQPIRLLGTHSYSRNKAFPRTRRKMTTHCAGSLSTLERPKSRLFTDFD